MYLQIPRDTPQDNNLRRCRSVRSWTTQESFVPRLNHRRHFAAADGLPRPRLDASVLVAQVVEPLGLSPSHSPPLHKEAQVLAVLLAEVVAEVVAEVAAVVEVVAKMPSPGNAWPQHHAGL